MGRRIYPMMRGWSFLWDQSLEGRCSDRSVRCWKGQTKFLCASRKRRSGEGAVAEGPRTISEVEEEQPLGTGLARGGDGVSSCITTVPQDFIPPAS